MTRIIKDSRDFKRVTCNSIAQATFHAAAVHSKNKESWSLAASMGLKERALMLLKTGMTKMQRFENHMNNVANWDAEWSAL